LKRSKSNQSNELSHILSDIRDGSYEFAEKSPF